MLRRLATHSPCGRSASGISSAVSGVLTACRSFSRCSASSSAATVAKPSTRQRPGARLGHGSLHEVFRARAPILKVDAVFGLEGVGDRLHVLRNGRPIDADHAFLLGARDQARHAVGALVGGDLGHVGLCQRGRAGKRRGDERGDGELQGVITGDSWRGASARRFAARGQPDRPSERSGAEFRRRKKTRCRAPFLGRQHPQYRGMSGRPAASAGPSKNASTGARKCRFHGLRARSNALPFST